jgi:LacI family transcriptional regulator
MTQGSIMALQDLGLRWPDDIDVAGFGAFAIAHLYNPPLTLIDQPTHDMGSLAVKLLIDQVENPGSQPQRVVLKNHIISRQEWRAWRYPDFASREGDLQYGSKTVTP